MSDFPVGKKIFEHIVEYPLPEIQGVRDYVFYFVGADDPFGKEARDFFSRYYPKHHPNDVKSLEALTGILYSEVKQGGISQVREVIILAHANAQQMLFKLVENTAGLPQYNILSPARLSALQQDFFDDKFPDFNTKRKEVIKHLTADSWITIRACNFGQNKDGLYALYSFFGGQANVYAPAVYQQFNWMDIGEGSRFEDKLRAHEHLVKQRILHRGHTPDRKLGVVNALVEPARFSIPVTLAKKKSTDTSSAGAQQYQAFKDDLNKLTITDLLKQELSTAQMELSAGAKLVLLEKDASWIITDKLQLEASSFDIEYDLLEQQDGDILHEQTVSVVAQARLRTQKTPDTRKRPVGDRFHFQLFIDELENRDFKGLLFFLAAYTEDSEKPGFDSMLGLLNAGGAVPASIATVFQAAGFELTGTPSITVQKPGKTWLINNQHPVLLKLQYAPSADNKKIARVIAVYISEDDNTRFAREGELLANAAFGKSPNLPGTELLAYLDKFPLTDLQDLIDYLRHPYQPENIIYLFHAINAAGRKNQTDSAKWLQGMTEINQEMLNNPLVRNPYTDLSILEQEDYLSDVYDFDVNTYWKQVKALNPVSKQLPADLFSDEPLPAAASYPDFDDMESDSASAQVNGTSVQQPGTEPYTRLEKLTVQIPEATEIDCDTYGILLEKIKALGTTDPEKIMELLGDEEVEGLHFRDYVMRGLSILNFTLELTEGFGVFAHSSVKIVSLFAHLLETTFMEVLSFIMPFIEVFVITLEVFLAEGEGAEHVEALGKRVAARQWVSDLEMKIMNKSIHFPGKIELDVHVLNEVDPGMYWFYRYQQEEMSQFPFRLTGSPVNEFNIFVEDFHRGFDEGWEEIEKMGNEALDKADDIFDEVLRRGGFDPCQVSKLRASGLIDMNNVSAVIMLEFVKLVRTKTSRHPQSEE